MKVVYDWLKEYVGEEMPTVEKLEELLTFHAFEVDGIEKVGNETVIDVKVLPDRSSDCLSHLGIAREISSLIGKPLTKDPLTNLPTLTPVTKKLKVKIENPEYCRRFTSALITGVSVAESPEWLRVRLEALGQRSINNIVDATNYVMFALGQPLHAYDATTFAPHDGVWSFGVRMSKEGEEVTTLSGDVISLTKPVQLIVDGVTDAPIGIAGIKGGKSAEITEATTTVILEAANFNPQITRRGSQNTRLGTDASKRFENDLPPELAAYGLMECVTLILNIAGGVCEGYIDEYPTQKNNSVVSVTRTHIESLLGLTLSDEVIEDIFTRLGFTFTKSGDVWGVTASFERTDIIIPEDVIAEVGRVYGYEHIKSVVPATVPLTELNTRHYYSEKIRDLLIEEGFSEVITSSFRNKDTIELLNALASDKGCLRSSLGENIREVLDRNMPNADLLGIKKVEVFEIGTVFHKTTDGADVTEHMSLCIGVRTKQQGYTAHDDERLKEVVSIIEKNLDVTCTVSYNMGVAEIDLTELLTKLPAPTMYDAYVGGEDAIFTPFSQYPFIARDIALWVPETVAVTYIETIIRENAGPLMVRLALFDEFKKDGRISYAFRLIFQSFERTLTDDEVNTVMEALYAELRSKNFEIR